ncbi:MAG: signal peptidase I [Candidatus Omnitrophica bacterium]|nr:signal peptidase I [Candidatus Omnitrophota bacterium]
MDKENKNKKGALREWVEALVIAGVLAIFLRTLFFQIYKIPTTSMVATLMPGDKIFVSKVHYGPKLPIVNFRIKGFTTPKRGEVIVFVPPQEAVKPWHVRKQYIKRLVALGGDRVLIKQGNLYINGEMIVDPKMAKNYYYNQGQYAKDGKEIIVPEGKYFFLGDNSMSSLDSRFWGFVDKEDIIGKAIFIWWNPKRIAMIE